jgi:phage antirepressor YoqD-like protein
MDKEKKEIFDIVGVKETGVIKIKSQRKKYSQRRIDHQKATKYTIRLYNDEYDIIRDQAKQLNITIQLLIDFLLVDGFIKKDKRIIDFINECIELQLNGINRKNNEINKFSNLDILSLINRIENKEE